MKCNRVRELIMTDYRDREVDAGAKEEVLAHLTWCSECRALEKRLNLVSSRLRSAKRPVPPERVWTNIRARISEEKPAFFRPLISPAPAVNVLWDRIRSLVLTPRFLAGKLALAAVMVAVVIGVYAHIQRGGHAALFGEEALIMTASESADDLNYDLGTDVEKYFL